MGRRPKKDQETDATAGQHLAFSDAVRLASSELLENRRGSGMLNLIGNALARLVPLYFQDSGRATPRALSQDELEGSQVMHRATVLLLKDGRSLSTIWIRRGDLRHGIAVLRTVGIPELGETPARNPATQQGELVAKVVEIERLVRPPLLRSQMDRANDLATSIARSAPDTEIGNLAVRLLRAIHDARAAADSADTRPIDLLVARMRDALRHKDKDNA